MRRVLILLLSLNSFSLSAQNSGWLYDLPLAQMAARANNKLILVDFWATWCGPCKKMDMEVWSTAEAEEIKKNFIPVKIDIDSEAALASRYGIRSIPNLLLMDLHGKVIHQQVGYSSKQDLLRFIKNIPGDVGSLNNHLETEIGAKDFSQLRDLGLAYQNLAKAVTYPALQRSFISESEQAFRKAAKKASTDAEKTEVELWSSLGAVIRGGAKKVRTEMLETQGTYTGTPNEALAYFVLLCACKESGDTAGYESALGQLKALPASGQFISLAEN
jgi:thioredoxin